MSFAGHKGISRHDGSDAASWLTYVCGHCGTQVSGAVVATYAYKPGNVALYVRWLLCPNCIGGSVESNNKIYPGSAFGPLIEGLPENLGEAVHQ